MAIPTSDAVAAFHRCLDLFDQEGLEPTTLEDRILHTAFGMVGDYPEGCIECLSGNLGSIHDLRNNSRPPARKQPVVTTIAQWREELQRQRRSPT